MFMGKEKALEELDALSRIRPLTSAETARLARAIKWEAEREGRKVSGQKPWTRADEYRLVRYVMAGKKPKMIAALMNRTERAVWRRMTVLGLSVGKLAPPNVQTASRIRVYERRAGGKFHKATRDE